WFTNLFKARDKPQNYSFGSNYSFIFGNSSSGKSVNEFTAMQMTAVYSCVRILAEAVAGLSLHLYKYTGTGEKEKALSHTFYFLVHEEPYTAMSSFVIRVTL